MRILIVGGTGLISSEIAGLLASHGHDLTLVTRGRSTTAAPPPGVHSMTADATDPTALRAALRGPRLRGERFDAVVQSVAFTPSHVADDIETFAPLTDQYILIATSASYRTYDRFHALTESDPQVNDYWEYAQLKAQAEQVLRDNAERAGLGWTIVRPAHTYGPSKIPAYTGNSRHPWTIVDRMRSGADIPVPGDGTALWTVTHASDVASGVVGLMGNERALGKAVHITSDEALTWNALYETIARAAGLSLEQWEAQRVCVPSDAMVAATPSLAGSLYGDKMHNAVYDTSLIKELVPGWQATVSFDEGIAECVAWFEADPSRQTTDADANAMFDRLSGIYRDALERARG